MFKCVEIAKAVGVAPPAFQEHIIRYMFARRLDFDPGSKSVYSNFGYCLLGRVIERAARKPYDQFVLDTLLKPLGIRHTYMGRTLEPGTGEVRYYDSDRSTGACVFPVGFGERVPAPYGMWCLEAMDAHGGWVSTAVDLVRFGSAFDQPARFPAFQGAAFKGRFGPPYHHTGGLAGTSTILRRDKGGVTWAVLFNANKAASGKWLADDVTPLVQKALAGVTAWPSEDRFRALKYDEAPRAG
jgi:N-acyl-D-amino-acid deacylase